MSSHCVETNLAAVKYCMFKSVMAAEQHHNINVSLCRWPNKHTPGIPGSFFPSLSECLTGMRGSFI